MPTPKEQLRAGCDLLEPVLGPRGFSFEFRTEGRGSGGDFASGAFVRGDRQLELHFRQSLGLVAFHVGAIYVPYEVFMRTAVGVAGRTAYPRANEDPLDAFRDLRADLESFAQVFLAGIDQDLVLLAQRALDDDARRPKGFLAIVEPGAG